MLFLHVRNAIISSMYLKIRKGGLKNFLIMIVQIVVRSLLGFGYLRVSEYMSFVIKDINYKKFIEDNFSLLDYQTQQPVPFKFNNVQEIYYEMLLKDYEHMEGVREIILKARREGLSSFVLALFTVDFLLRPYSVSICISHKKDVTERLLKQVKFYIETFIQKQNEIRKTTLKMEDYLVSDTKGMIVNRLNKAEFYIGTAGAKVGGRGGFARNIHFSEAAFYQDTEKITAEEMITATAQQVPLERGMIFIESTANGEGNYYHGEWQRSYIDKKSSYVPRFFSWDLFYTEAQVNARRKEFSNDMMWKQEYPRTPEEAFRFTGSPFFDMQMLSAMQDKKSMVLESGRLAADGLWI